jgi:hypothetical protein
MQQANAIAARFGVPPYLLPRLLAGSYMPVVKKLVLEGSSPLGTAISHSRAPSCNPGALETTTTSSSPSDASVTALAVATQPAAGTPAWRCQLERIQSVCRDAGIEHNIIDGFLASAVCGGAGATTAPVAAESVKGSACVLLSGCLSSWTDNDNDVDMAVDPEGVPGQRKMAAVMSALDLLELDVPGCVADLGAELVDTLCADSSNMLTAKWAP